MEGQFSLNVVSFCDNAIHLVCFTSCQPAIAPGDVAMERYDYSLYAITCFVWGTSWLALRMQLGTVAPEVSLVWRFALAGILVFAWALWARQRMRFELRDHALFAAMGFFIFSTNFLFSTMAASRSPLACWRWCFRWPRSSTFSSASPSWARKPSRDAWPVLVLGALGIGFLFWPEIAGTTLNRDVLIGLALCICGTLFFCTGNVLSARAQKRGLPILATNAWGMLYGVIWLLVLAMAQGHTFAIEPTAATSARCLACHLFLGDRVLELSDAARPDRRRAGILCHRDFSADCAGLLNLFEGYQWTVFAVIGVVFALCGNVLVLGGGKRQPVNKGA
jgi:drug/metabolite transporter (DMT)-like permease